MIVLEIKFGDRAVMKIYPICHIVGILTLIVNLTYRKEAKAMRMLLDKRYLKNGFLYFFNIICCWYTLELSHRDNFNIYRQQWFSNFYHKPLFTNFSTILIVFEK